MVYLNDDIDSIDVGSALRAVSPQRREKALRYRQLRDQKLSLAVYLLLAEGLAKEYGIHDPPEFAFGPHGKPHLANHPGIHFNLSHCREAALCVIADTPVGCDIESVPATLDMDLCRHCFNNQELASIFSSPSPTIAFTTLWTKKEALLKLTGQGLASGFSILNSQSLIFNSHIAPDHSYVYTQAFATS